MKVKSRKGDKIKFAIDAPKEIRIHRDRLYHQADLENQQLEEE